MQAYSHLKDQSDAVQEHLLESRETAYRGFARVDLSCLSPAFSLNRVVCHKHVERLKAIFSEQGVRRNDPDHRIPVLISEELLSQTLLNSNLSERDLFDRSLNDPPILNLPEESLHYLHGRHRILAAQDILLPIDRWWIVDIYLNSRFPITILKVLLD